MNYCLAKHFCWLKCQARDCFTTKEGVHNSSQDHCVTVIPKLCMYVCTYVVKFVLHVLSISVGKSGSAEAHNATAVGKQFVSYM